MKLNIKRFFKDVYSYGMVLYEMFSGETPFQELSSKNVEVT